MKAYSIKWFLLMQVMFMSQWAHAYPVIDKAVSTGEYPIKVYRDHESSGVYWYIPISIDPWSRDSRYRSAIFKNDDVLSFVFRGQPSVDEEILRSVARSIGTSVDHLTPIAYEYSRDFICQNFYAGDSAVSWQFPKMIGNYLEVVPVSLRAKGSSLVKEIGSLIESGGLACTVSVGFKGVSTGYKVKMKADMNRVYERFEAGAHAEGLWWEVDIHALVESLRKEGAIEIKSLEDTSIPQTELDKKIQASMDQVTQKVIELLFVQNLKLPNEPMQGRGKPFSLRVDYRKTEESGHFQTSLIADKVQIKDSQISLRMALQ